MERTTVSIDDRAFALAQGTDTRELKARMEKAVHSGGRFVDFTIVGNRSVSVLVSVGVPIVFEIETIEEDLRDDGDLSHPYDDLAMFVPDDFYGA